MWTKTLRMAFVVPGVLMMMSNIASAELLRKPSTHPVKETMDKLEAILKDKGFTIFARIDHAAGAKSVGADLRPTELIIFGNPAGGTPLIQAAQSMGLTLPLKVLTWQDEDGKTWIGYDELAPQAMARGIDKTNPVVAKISSALDNLTTAAAQ